jgi:hypothetical protein
MVSSTNKKDIILLILLQYRFEIPYSFIFGADVFRIPFVDANMFFYSNLLSDILYISLEFNYVTSNDDIKVVAKVLSVLQAKLLDVLRDREQLILTRISNPRSTAEPTADFILSQCKLLGCSPLEYQAIFQGDTPAIVKGLMQKLMVCTMVNEDNSFFRVVKLPQRVQRRENRLAC